MEDSSSLLRKEEFKMNITDFLSLEVIEYAAALKQTLKFNFDYSTAISHRDIECFNRDGTRMNRFACSTSGESTFVNSFDSLSPSAYFNPERDTDLISRLTKAFLHLKKKCSDQEPGDIF